MTEIGKPVEALSYSLIMPDSPPQTLREYADIATIEDGNRKYSLGDLIMVEGSDTVSLNYAEGGDVVLHVTLRLPKS
jgi:hypothetical protein